MATGVLLVVHGEPVSLGLQGERGLWFNSPERERVCISSGRMCR